MILLLDLCSDNTPSQQYTVEIDLADNFIGLKHSPRTLLVWMLSGEKNRFTFVYIGVETSSGYRLVCEECCMFFLLQHTLNNLT